MERNQGRINTRRNGFGISPSSFCRIIEKDSRWFPYKMIRCLNLKDGNCERRSRFCQWFLRQCNKRRILANIVIGDEAGFDLNGTVNNHNVRMYASANQPPNVYGNVNDSRQKLTVWVGLCGNGDKFGPFLFDGNVNGSSCLNLLNNQVIPLMTVSFRNQFCGNRFERLWWAQDWPLVMASW